MKKGVRRRRVEGGGRGERSGREGGRERVGRSRRVEKVEAGKKAGGEADIVG